MDNKNGEWELKGLAALGFTFKYNGKDMNSVIDKHKRGLLSQIDAASYGLEIKYYAVCPKVIMSYDAAMPFFGIRSYTSRNLWKKGGPICNRAMTVDLSKIYTAIDCFKKSRNLRDLGGRDSGHEHMFLNQDACITERTCKNAKVSSSGVAATRGAGTIGTQDTFLNTRTHRTDEGAQPQRRTRPPLVLLLVARACW